MHTALILFGLLLLFGGVVNLYHMYKQRQRREKARMAQWHRRLAQEIAEAHEAGLKERNHEQ